MKIALDAPRLRKALEHITAHPEEHDQRFWAVQHSCGTALCLAGTIVHQAGLEIDWKHVTEVQDVDRGKIRSATRLADGRSIDAAAVELLGLNSHGIAAGNLYGELFATHRTLPELWRNASKLTGGEIEVPAQFRED